MLSIEIGTYIQAERIASIEEFMTIGIIYSSWQIKIFIVSPNVAAERQKQLYKSHLDILDEILEYDE